MAASTLTGSTGNDTLNAPGSVSTLVQGLEGNDTISLVLANDEAQGGAGNDSIALTRAGTTTNTVYGGAGNDTVWIRSSASFQGYVDLGAGNDTIRIGSAGADAIANANVFGGEGADTLAISNTVTNSTIGAGSSTDLIVFSAGGSVSTSLVFGGKQADTIRFNAGDTASVASIGGGKGGDYLAFSQSTGAFTDTNIGGGQGTDSIELGTGAKASVSGGGLNDTINAGVAFGGGSIYGDGVGVTTAGTGADGAADGADLISFDVALGGATSVYGAGGNDTITIASGVANVGQINGGDGNDTITLAGSAADHLATAASIVGGAGNDTITVGSALYGTTAIASVGTINGGAGSDLIIIKATSGALNAGSYSASNISALSAVGFVIAGAGSGDVIRIGANSTITGDTQQNWAGGTPQVFVASSLSSMSAGVLANLAVTATAGSVAVFSDGTDTVISVTVGDQALSVYSVVLDGVDLVTTTLVGNVSLASSNFGFTVAAAGSEGLNITLS